MKHEEVLRALLDAGWSESVARSDIANCGGDPARLEALKNFAAENGGQWETAAQSKEKKKPQRPLTQRRPRLAQRKALVKASPSDVEDQKGKTSVAVKSTQGPSRRYRSERQKSPAKKQDRRKVKFEDDNMAKEATAEAESAPVQAPPPVPVHPASHKWVGIAKKLASQQIADVTTPVKGQAVPKVESIQMKDVPQAFVKNSRWPRQKTKLEVLEETTANKQVADEEEESKVIIKDATEEATESAADPSTEVKVDDESPERHAETPETGSSLIEDQASNATVVEEGSETHTQEDYKEETAVREEADLVTVSPSEGLESQSFPVDVTNGVPPRNIANVTLPESVNPARFAQPAWGGYMPSPMGYGWPYSGVPGAYPNAHPAAGGPQQTWGYASQYYPRSNPSYWHPQASKQTVMDGAAAPTASSMYVPYVPPPYVYQSMPNAAVPHATPFPNPEQ